MNCRRTRRETAVRMAVLGAMDDERRTEVEKAIDDAANEYGVTSADIFSTHKSALLGMARGQAAYVMYEAFDLSYTTIAKIMGGCHSTYVRAAERWGRSQVATVDNPAPARPQSGEDVT